MKNGDFMGFHRGKMMGLLGFHGEENGIYSGYLWEYHVYIIINMKTRYGTCLDFMEFHTHLSMGSMGFS